LPSAGRRLAASPDHRRERHDETTKVEVAQPVRERPLRIAHEERDVETHGPGRRADALGHAYADTGIGETARWCRKGTRIANPADATRCTGMSRVDKDREPH